MFSPGLSVLPIANVFHSFWISSLHYLRVTVFSRSVMASSLLIFFFKKSISRSNGGVSVSPFSPSTQLVSWASEVFVPFGARIIFLCMLKRTARVHHPSASNKFAFATY